MGNADLALEAKCTASSLVAQPGAAMELQFPPSPHLPAGLSLSCTATRQPVALRPILCGEIATRVAVGASYDLQASAISAAFPDVQLGVGVRGGSEAAFHDVVMGLESGLAVCDLDFENAFGLRSSRACFLAMKRFPQLAPLLRPFHCLYRHPAPIFVGDGRGNLVWCHANTTGPRQGCILGSVAFCHHQGRAGGRGELQAPELRGGPPA